MMKIVQRISIAHHLGHLELPFITCSAMIPDADWSIGVRSGAAHPL